MNDKKYDDKSNLLWNCFINWAKILEKIQQKVKIETKSPNEIDNGP